MTTTARTVAIKVQMPEFLDCSTCREYAERRRNVVVPALIRRAGERGMHVRRLAQLYMTGVHRRHLNGLPL